MGTNHSSGAERGMRNKFGYKWLFNLLNYLYITQFVTFVCVISIGVKSKYGSCNGSCTGFFIIKNRPINYIKFIGINFQRKNYNF